MFTPRGDIHTLPRGATALDFAFKIHTDIGLRCLGAKVNLKLSPASNVLKSGDQVEIITSESQQPKPEWLDFVVTARAKSILKSVFKKERRKIILTGKNIIDNILKEQNLKITPEIQKKIFNQFKIQHIDDFYFYVGKKDVNEKAFLKIVKEGSGRFVSYWKLRFRRSKTEQNTTNEKEPQKIKSKKNKIRISDQDFLNYRLATCCNPIPGDDVTSFNDPVENLIIIHNRKCPKAIELSSSLGNQIIETEWITHRVRSFPATIALSGIDTIGLLNQATNVISQEYNVNMKSLTFDTKDGVFEGTITLDIHHVVDLKNLIAKLLKIKGLKKVYRI